MIPRYIYIFNLLFHCFARAKLFPKTRVGCIWSSDFPRDNFPSNSYIFSPGYRTTYFNVCSKTSLLVEEVNKREPVYDFVFVMICMTVSSTSMQLKKRQKLFIHPIEYTAVFTRYRFLYSNNFITVILFIFPQNPHQRCFPINTIFTTCCSRYGTAKVIIVLNHTHNNWDTRI